ncbi:hypothetical protein M405DRAFT_374202 [Rhizopogon salebrosus TDB-379]|nr:hypothetical protein M405DRAFT_374202 [Rhizopogon salebrosus TDB-379]
MNKTQRVHHVRVPDIFRLVTNSLRPSSNIQYSLSRIARTSTTAHDQRRHFALGVAGILLVDQHGAVGDGGVVTDDRGTHVHPILKKVRKHGGGGLQRN